MTPLEIVWTAFIVYLVLVLLASTLLIVRAVVSLVLFRKKLAWEIAAREMEKRGVFDIELSDFDWHVATTPGMIDNTND